MTARTSASTKLFFRRRRPGDVIGEFSVLYLLERDAARDISREFPDAKIIAILREPVSRFISHYRFRRHTLQTEHRPMEELLNPAEELVGHGMSGRT